MKILSTEGLTKLIQLIKNSFISVNDTVTTDTITLADVATTGDYNDLINTPNIPVYTAGEGIDITNNVIGTNIKTINNESLLGSGNISISADNIFVAEYGVTTYTDAKTAYDAGKQLICSRTESSILPATYWYICTSWVEGHHIVGDNFTFSAINGTTSYSIKLNSKNGWSVSTNSLGTVKKVNNTFPDSNGNVTINIPTKISDLTDDTATNPIDKADTLTDLTATVAELNYVDGVTSAIQTQLDGKQATLVSGTNIKTINNESLLGNGNVSTTQVIIRDWA